MGEGPKDDPAHIKCTMLGPQAKERPHLCISSGSLVKAEPQILQQGDSQGGVRLVQGEGKTALQSPNKEEVSGWYTGEETQGHRDSNHHTRTSSLKKEGKYLRKTTHTDNI